MASFTHEYSNFPNEVITIKEYKDVDDAVASLVQQINSYRNTGDFASANQLIAENKALLSAYNFASEDINRIVEEIRNAQVYAKEGNNTVYYMAEEPDAHIVVGDTWLDTSEAVESTEVERTDADEVYSVAKTADDGYNVTSLMTFNDGSTYTVTQPISPVTNKILKEVAFWDTDAESDSDEYEPKVNTYTVTDAGYYLACGWVSNSDGGYNDTDNKAINITTTGTILSEFYNGYEATSNGWICHTWIYANAFDTITISTIGNNPASGNWYKADQYILALVDPVEEENEEEG